MTKYLMLAVCLVACGNPEYAKASALGYAKELGLEVAGVTCAGTDTDNDGYISCSVRVKDTNQILALDCSRGEYTFAQGCKVAPAYKVERK